jgi:hypothetical protein
MHPHHELPGAADDDASSSAVSRPIPVEAPITTTTCSANGFLPKQRT